jgi:peptide deformylase
MIYDLLVLGHPNLRQKCYDVTEFGTHIVDFLGELRETMRAARGVGLAAPQVDSTLRVAVIEVDGVKFDLVNPVIVSAEGPKTLGEEGCLSIPDVFEMVARSENITLRTHDPKTGEPKTFNIKGFMARAIQHEVDHLDGKLFIDHLGEFKRRAALRAWHNQSKQYPNGIRHLVQPTRRSL